MLFSLSSYVRARLHLLLIALVLLALPAAPLFAEAASRRQVREWTRLLTSDDPQKRSSAATSLLAADGDAALPVLIDSLAPAQPKNVRISVITAFGVKGDDRAVRQIIATLADQDLDLRDAATAALQSIFTSNAIQALVEASSDDKRPPQLRVQTIAILGNLRAMEAIQPLIGLLSAPDESVRKSARASLERVTLRSFDTTEKWVAWWKHSSVLSREEMLEELVSLQNEKIRGLNTLVESLHLNMLQDRKDKTDPAPLIAILRDSDSEKVKLECIKELSPLRGKGTAEALVGAVDDADPAVRVAAADALGAQGDDSAVAPLIKALGDDMVAVRAAAAKSLGALKAKEALPALCERLKDTAPESSAAAARAIGELADPAALEALTGLVTSEKTPPAAYEAGVSALAKIRDPRAVPTLVALMDSKNEKVRWTAVDALGSLGAKEGVAPLCAVAQKDTNPQIRKTALAALSKIGDPGAMNCVVDGLADSEQQVADQALLSLLALAGTDGTLYDKALDRLLTARRYPVADKVLLNALEQVGKTPNQAEQSAVLRYRMATGLIATQEWKLARPHLEALVAKAPGESRYMKNLITCLAGQGDVPALLKTLAQARKGTPDKAEEWWLETVKAVEMLAAGVDQSKVIAAVDALEKDSPDLGGPTSSTRLRELRAQAVAKPTAAVVPGTAATPQ